MTGWECPKCHQCFAPSVTKCDKCVAVTFSSSVWPDVSASAVVTDAIATTWLPSPNTKVPHAIPWCQK